MAAVPRGGSLNAKFMLKSKTPPTIFARIDRPMHALQYSVFLTATYNVHLRLAGLPISVN